MTKRERRTCTPEFKKQMVQLYQNGKTKRAIIDEYDLTPSSLYRWINQDEVLLKKKTIVLLKNMSF
ncbi:helix-turn-helix domain-containing protein [Niallia taxi]|uniref:HTH psq-type domain-containing protein n=1 Tax=Niallia taxi TaxID=2499688 RepID=A0A3S2X5F4_9BACI|nr:helix-turn-helix domain-containing protein [Niallia taxi]RVT57221.1 hypothetical protein EM808_25110 [Niallia taxi]